VRHVREADLTAIERPAVKRGFATIAQAQSHGPRLRVDVDHVAGDAVADRAEVRVLDRRADDNVVAGSQAVGPACHRHAVSSDLAVLQTDRLGSSVERIELLVRRLRDNQRLTARATIGLGGVEREILELSLISLDHNEPAL
jgi:hypothetical protein